MKGWSDSNPLGYIDWFKRRSRLLLVEPMFDKAAAMPEQQAVGEKRPLELVVQLIKRCGTFITQVVIRIWHLSQSS